MGYFPTLTINVELICQGTWLYFLTYSVKVHFKKKAKAAQLKAIRHTDALLGPYNGKTELAFSLRVCN